jgi:hypothetical protein
MGLDFTGLTDLANGTTKSKADWEPLTHDDLGYGTVMAFDQSLTATGLVVVRHIFPESAPQVLVAQSWSAEDEGKDVETSLRRGVQVYKQAVDVMRSAQAWQVDAFIHESPPNPKAVKGGGYSSLLAAQAVRCAAEASGWPMVMLGAQPAKKLVCGNANAPKQEAHKALKETVMPWVINSGSVTNEATRDALMVALLWLARRKQ